MFKFNNLNLLTIKIEVNNFLIANHLRNCQKTYYIAHANNFLAHLKQSFYRIVKLKFKDEE